MAGKRKQAVPCAMVISSRPLNLRQGPHTCYRAVQQLPSGTRVEIVQIPVEVSLEDWVPVRCGEAAGWVMRAYLQEITELQTEPQEAAHGDA